MGFRMNVSAGCSPISYAFIRSLIDVSLYMKGDNPRLCLTVGTLGRMKFIDFR